MYFSLLKTRLALGTVLALASVAAFAMPMTGYVENSGNYSLLHPMPSVTSADYWRFGNGQAIDFDLTDNILTILDPQMFSLYHGGDVGSFELSNLKFDLNGANGFAGGTMGYVFNGQPGKFVFIERSYGQSVFNSSSWEGGILSVFAWGGDPNRPLGIDFSISGMIPTVPEPGTLALLGLGLAGFAATRRRTAKF